MQLERGTASTADHDEQDDDTYVLTIHQHILNSQNNKQLLYMYFSIWNLLIHLHGSSMPWHYVKYFPGAYLPETNMQGMHILRKYVGRTNVLANFKQGNTYMAIFYCSKYLKYANALLIHMCRCSIHCGLLCDKSQGLSEFVNGEGG